MRVHSETFQYAGYTWQLDIDAQVPAQYVATKSPTKGLCVFLTLRDADIIAPEDMPYVRCTMMTVNNHANRENDIMQVLQRQFRSGSTGGVALWSTPALLLAHKRLEEMKEEVMPEGDLHLLLRFERVLPAKDCASRLGCTVAEYLAKVAPATTDQKAEEKNNEKEGTSEWLCGDGKDFCTGATSIWDAVKCSPALYRRIRAAQLLSPYSRHVDDFQAALCVLETTLECKATTEALLAYFGGDKPHDDSLKTGCAEGEYLYILEGLEKHISDTDTSHKKIKSDKFDVAAFSWNLLLFPQGSNGRAQSGSCISIFLQLADSKHLPMADLPETSFTLTVVNRADPAGSVAKESTHRFTPNEDDWGFAEFIKISALTSAREQFMPDGNLHIRVNLKVKVEEKYIGVTRQLTGYVGVKNQVRNRHSCHTPCRRDCAAEYSQTLVSTKQLVQSFGWTAGDAFVQQDVEELELKLCDKLEEKMKGLKHAELKENEHAYTLKEAGSLLKNSSGALRVHSETFHYAGYTWQLCIDAQRTVSGVRPKKPVKSLYVYLTLRDADIIAPEDMPYVRCRMSIINRANRNRNITQVLQKQYRSGASGGIALWSRSVFTVSHTLLEESKEEVMPEGDLHMLLHFERVFPAKDCASRQGCTVAEYLAKSAPADLESEAEKENNEETGSTAWLCGKDVCAGAIAVRDAVNHNPALCRRICAAQRLSLYGTTGDDFQAVLCMLRSTLECKAATEALLAHFGGDRPHDAVVACLAADPAGLLRHISDSVGPRHASRGEGKGESDTIVQKTAARRGMRALLCGA